jgi:hypothetical protein
MKPLNVILILTLTVIALGLSPQSASAGAFTYFSSINLYNLEATTANIQLIFYNQDGTTEPVVNDTIPGNSTKIFFPLPVGSGFNGSVVVSSSTQVASVSNIVGDSFAATGAYVGADQGSLNANLPLLMKNNSGYNTWFNVQNVGGVDANVDVTYDDLTLPTVVIKPGASHTFDQTTEAHTMPIFSASITSSQPIAVTAIEENTDIIFAYSGYDNTGASFPVMPIINSNNSGYISSATIKNNGGAPTTVTVSYTPGDDGTACTETQTILAGENATFTLFAFAGVPLPGMTTNCIGGERFLGSARVSSNSASQPLTVIVNQLGSHDGEAYGAFDPTAATGEVVLPLIMDRNSGYWTSINLMNVGVSQTTVTCEFSGTTYSFSEVLDPNEGVGKFQYGQIADGYLGSATCTATGDGKIVAVVNELGPSATDDQLLVYEGINVTPTP